MADYITKIRTLQGDKQYDYNSLANLPYSSPLTSGTLEQDAQGIHITLPKGITKGRIVLDAVTDWKTAISVTIYNSNKIDWSGKTIGMLNHTSSVANDKLYAVFDFEIMGDGVCKCEAWGQNNVGLTGYNANLGQITSGVLSGYTGYFTTLSSAEITQLYINFHSATFNTSSGHEDNQQRKLFLTGTKWTVYGE